MSKAEFLFLGTGSSAGVPVIGCSCSVCMSSSRYNKRTRPSALIKNGKKTFLIDVGPDFRFHALAHGIKNIDGLFLTHTHYDHIGGIDELRTFYIQNHKKIPCVLSKESYNDLKERYNYLMQPITEHGSFSAQIDFQVLKEEFGFGILQDLSFSYVSFTQTGMVVTGFILGNLAYISDIKEYSDTILEHLKGIEILVISAAKEEASRMHLGLQEAIEFSKKVGAKKTFFTHVSHDIDHEIVSKRLPPDMQLAYDGLKIEFSI